MIKLTNVSVAKVQDSGEVNSKRPTHNLVAADEKYENKTVVASFWTKEGQYGKFLSGSMKKSRTSDDGKEYDGYVIITEREWDEYQSLKKGEVKTGGYTGEVADTSEIDF